MHGNGVGCAEVSGRFVVLEAELDGARSVSKLAIDFEQHCDGEEPALFGSVRYNSAIPASKCIAAVDTLCLHASRFKIRARFEAAAEGSGAAHVVDLTGDTGAFWFLAAANLEALIKVLDDCGVNGHYWVFAGGLTSVGVITTVTDTRSGVTRTYESPINTPFAPLQDTLAFSTCP